MRASVVAGPRLTLTSSRRRPWTVVTPKSELHFLAVTPVTLRFFPCSLPDRFVHAPRVYLSCRIVFGRRWFVYAAVL